MPADERVLVIPTDRFRAAGYGTAAFVSAFVLDRRYGLDAGFETYDDRVEGGGAEVSGWTAERQRKFIEHLSLTGSVGEASAVAGVSSRSAYRLRNKAGAESFARPGPLPFRPAEITAHVS